MARLYSYIQQVREENPVVFLVDAGDAIQGTIMTDDIANRRPDSAHPVIAAMDYMGYDAMTVGNHEFNWGIETMKQILSQASFPVLGANVLDANGNYVTGDGWVIVERGGVRLAVIGVCTPDIPIWDGGKEGIDDTTFEPGNVAVKKAIEEICDQADILLVSAHMGQYAEFDEDGGSDAGGKIVEDNPEVDILQVAHMHITVNDQIGETPVVGVRNSGREIARVDVTLDQDKQIKDISTEIVDMADFEPSEEIREIPVVKALHEETINLIRGGVGADGEPGEPLGTSTAKFQPEDEIAGLPESAINYGSIFDIYKFDNTLCTLDVTGRELKGYMEWSAECYNQWMSGDVNISFDPEYPNYRYDMFAGVDYEINLSKPKGGRIENVRFRSEPLRDDRS